MTSRLYLEPERYKARQFAERALIDFALLDAFEARPEPEREACLRWIALAASMGEQESRVTRMLGELVSGNPLPSSGASPRASDVMARAMA